MKTPEKPSGVAMSPKSPKRNHNELIVQDHHSTISSKELEHLSPSQIQIQITNTDSHQTGN